MVFRDLNYIDRWRWKYSINKEQIHYIYQVELSSENIDDLDFIWYILTEEPYADGESYQYKRSINIITMDPEIFFRMKKLNMVFKEIDNISLMLTRREEGDSIAEEFGSLSSDMAGSMCFQFPETIYSQHKVILDGGNIIFQGFTDEPQVISRNEDQIDIGKKLEKLVKLDRNNLYVNNREVQILNYFFDMGVFRRFPKIRDLISELNFIYY